MYEGGFSTRTVDKSPYASCSSGSVHMEYVYSSLTNDGSNGSFDCAMIS